MQLVPITIPPSRRLHRGWRALILLFAGLLTLGILQPLTATAASPPLLKVKDRTVLEHDYDTTAKVKIVLDHRAHRRVSVGFSTREGTAEAGEDYLPVHGRAYFPRGTRVVVVRVPILGDTEEEADEYFKVRLFDAHRARIADRVGYVDILDDDETVWPDLSVDNVVVHEGEAARFTVELSFDAPEPVRFDYATKEGTADAGKDYDSTSGSKVIDEGDDSVTVTVMTREDDFDERYESFFLDIDDVRYAHVEDGLGRATIIDDDEPTPRLWVGDAGVTEGGPAHFRVHLSAPAPEAVTFDFATADGPLPNRAEAGKDYDSTTGNDVVIPKGSEGTTVTVMTRNDDFDEPNETFLLDVKDVHNASVADGQGKATIFDTD